MQIIEQPFTVRKLMENIESTMMSWNSRQRITLQKLLPTSSRN